MAISTNSPEKSTDQQQPPPDQSNPPKPDPQLTSTPPPSTIPVTLNPNPSINNSQPPAIAPPQQQQQVQSFVSPSIHPSFRPVPIPSAPQFSPIPNPTFQNHAIQAQVQPPGVMAPAQVHYGQQPMRMYAPMPNGYQMAVPVPQGTMNPPGGSFIPFV